MNDTGEEKDDNISGSNAIDISNTVTELVGESNLEGEKLLSNSSSCIVNHTICTSYIAEEKNQKNLVIKWLFQKKILF